MRRIYGLWPLLLPALVFTVTEARAQFQPPTPEELKMTVDPKYPDAAAVILNYDEKTDHVIGFKSVYMRVKVLSEKAKDLATVHVGYIRGPISIAEVSGRTIHADGTIVPLTVKPADLMLAKQGDAEIRETVFNMPAVEVGSIVEYYYQVRAEHYCPTPHWELQREYPIRREHYSFTPCRGILDGQAGLGGFGVIDRHHNVINDMAWYVNLPPGKTLAPTAAHKFELTLEDIPPLRDEPWIPPVESQRYEVRFYFTPGTSGAAYWNSEAKYWLKDVDHFAEPSGGIKAVVAGIVAPTDAPLEKAKKLYAAVQGLDNTAFSRQKGKAELKAEGLKEAKRAEDTWNQKSGSPEDITLLYLAMLRAAGLNAYPMKVVNRAIGLFNVNYLYFDQLNDSVVVLNVGGKEMVLDPGQKMCPFGLASWQHSGAGGVRQTDKGTDAWITPLLGYADNVVTRRGEITMAADGSMTGKLHLSMTGQEALRWRQQAMRVDEDQLKKEFNDWLRTQLPSGVDAHVDRFMKLDDPTAELHAYATATGSLGTTTGKRMMLPASFFSFGEDRRFTEQPNRMLPVDMHFESQVKDGVLYHLPAGYTVEATPPAASVPWPQHAVFSLKTAAGPTGVTVINSLTRAFTFAQPEEYPALRDFYQKVGSTSQQQIVLIAGAAPAAGN